MRGSGIAVVALVALPLGGCFSSIVAQKEVPAWAMSPQVQADPSLEPARKVARSRPAQRAASRQAQDGNPTNSQAVGLNQSYGTEWQAREKERDDRLRQQLNICRGC